MIAGDPSHGRQHYVCYNRPVRLVGSVLICNRVIECN